MNNNIKLASNSESNKNLLIEESPEDGKWEEEVGDGLEGLDVVDEGLSVFFFREIQNRIFLLGLATAPPLGKRMLKNFEIKFTKWSKI